MMGNYFLKKGKSSDKSFDTEQEALDEAKGLSDENRCPQFVIESGGLYFVSTTDNVQRYEKLVAAYKSGVRILIKT